MAKEKNDTDVESVYVDSPIDDAVSNPSTNVDEKCTDTDDTEYKIVPQPHSWLARVLLGSKIVPIPEQRSASTIERGYISRATFAWLDPLIRIGYDRVLVLRDIPLLPKRNSMERRLAEFHNYVDRHKGSNYVEVWGLFYAMRYTLVTVVAVQVVYTGSSVGQSVLSRYLIDEAERLTNLNGHGDHGAVAACTIVNTLLNIFTTFSNVYVNYMGHIMAEMARTLVMAAIHEKIMRLSPQQRHDFPAGKTVSLMTSDARRGSIVFQFLAELIISPFYLGAIIGVLVFNIGVSGLAGFGLLIVALGLNFSSAVLSAKLRLKSMPYQDKRVSLTRETVKNMSVIKFYGWEKSFLSIIQKARNIEAKYIRLIELATSATIAIVFGAPTYAGALSFAVRILMGHNLSPDRAFPSLTLFSMFLPIFGVLTMAIASFADAWVAAKRMNKLFRLPGVADYIEPLEDSNAAFVLRAVSVAWELDDETKDTSEDEKDKKKDKKNKKHEDEDEDKLRITKVILSNVNLTIMPGTFNLVAGPVGCGKTTLLSTFVGTVPLHSGHVYRQKELSVSNALSYWSRNATIRDNILFGKEWNSRLYEEVVNACDLTSDFELFANADKTEVGENGVTLSGGQRARLALARCLYADRDVIVLDDVLSAMDARVGNFVFRKLLSLVHDKGKTIIYSTNNSGHFQYADLVIAMDGSGSCICGSPSTIIPSLISQIKVSKEEEQEEKSSKDNVSGKVVDETHVRELAAGMDDDYEYFGAPDIMIEELADAERLSVTPSMKSVVVAKTQKAATNMDEETRAFGSVDFNILMRYFQLNTAFGVFLAIVALFIATAYGTAGAMQNVVLNWWTSDRFHMPQGFNIGMYCLVAFMSTVSMMSFSNVMTYYATNSSSRLFNLALKAVYSAPLTFFQSNPLGRIITRFTEDVVNLDTRLLMYSRILFTTLMSLIGNMIVIFVYVPWSILCLVPVVIGSVILMAFYRTSSRELNRVKQLCDSRVMTTITEDTEGQEVIAAFDQQKNVSDMLDARFDTLLSAIMCNEGSHYWMALRDSLLSEILTLVAIFLAVFQVMHLNASDVGMLLTSLPSVTLLLSNVFPFFAMFENQLNSVERLDDYAFRLKPEGHWVAEDPQLSNWSAKQGTIEFDDVVLRYKPDLPPALSNLSFRLEGQKRLGICGRTGAGKSTLISAIFRLIELSSGQIKIDGVPIDTIPLETLRGQLSIIPQQPVLFQGTIRSNLDPFEEHTDQELWAALNRVSGLLTSGDGSKFHLDSKVDAEGTNFSLGERQVFALSRTLVRDAKILVLDEATAAVDEAMDAKIQATIKTELSHCTIVCIAHRLNTILDYDEIMVLGPGGRLLEMGTPSELLAMDGEFAAMVAEH